MSEGTFVNPKELNECKNSGICRQTLSLLGQKILYFHNDSIQKRTQKGPEVRYGWRQVMLDTHRQQK